MRGLFLLDFFSQFAKFTEDENQLNYNKCSFNVNRPASSSLDPAIFFLSHLPHVYQAS